MDRSLDLSHIGSQNEGVQTVEHLAPVTGVSLQNILEQFDKLDDEQKPQNKKIRIRKTAEKRFSVPHFEVNTQTQSPKNFVLNVRKSLISPTKRNSEKISLTNVPTIQETELIEANHLGSGSGSGSLSISPRRPTIALLQGEAFERRSSLFVMPRAVESTRDFDNQPKALPSLITPRKVGEQSADKPDVTDTRRFSSPMLIGGPQFRAGLPNPLKISKELKLNSFRDSPNGSKNLDMSPGLSPGVSPSKSTTRSGTLASGVFDSKQANSGPRSSWTVESSNLLPISNDYLLKVILNKTGGSNPGSHSGSPNAPGTPENSTHQGYQFGKRGSFSVFRKVVETEVVKNG